MHEKEHQTNGYVAATEFLREHPGPNWLLILKACVKEARRTKEVGFAGAWVLREAQQATGVRWFPNLRPLVSARILRRTEVSRGGKRAYYVMIDPEGVEEALR